MSIELVNVGVAQLKIASSPVILRTILGSCVGICIYDRNKKMGGLAHVLLSKATNDSQPEKFAETAIPALIEQLLRQGCKRDFMTAKIAGGASMFKFASQTPLGLIGENNISMTKKILEEKKIPIVGEDTGGSVGRVIDFFLEDGRLKVKAGGHEEYYYKV
ncbi:MAG: chemotaxis protein CheD [Spirochaetes bacterium]|nr:chemotaxis protein CheD [Spirochaetota bacterium]MBN2770022.1 chemotaxis protein CheD [Spirochaetota bacterium]